MTCKLNASQFSMLSDALECDLRTLIKFHDAAIHASVEAFEMLEKHRETQPELRETALQVSAVADVLESLFFARFPAAARELFPNHNDRG